MTDHADQIQPRFRVIDGVTGDDGFRAARRARAARPVHLAVGPSELAAEMAVIYALSLLREVPLADLDNPHKTVRVNAHTSFTLHELLCELRSLPWLDRQAVPSRPAHRAGAAAQGLPDEEEQRRASRWNGDGQLTLRMLLRGATISDSRGPLLSRLVPCLEPGGCAGLDAAFETMPATGEPRAVWQAWLEANRLEAEALSGHLPATLCDLVAMGHPASPGRAPLALALSLAAIGLPPVPALAQRGWGGADLMPLMAEAVWLCAQAARAQSAQADRMRRPVVLAARISLMTGRDGAPANSADALARQVLDELRRHAPRLLMWVALRNASDGSGSFGVADMDDTDPRLTPAMRMRDNLMLPPALRDGLPLHPSDALAQATVAGACTTLLKAVFAGPFSATSPNARTGMGAAHAGSSPHMLPRRPGMASELDKLASNMVLGRLVTGGYFHFENLAALRKGERIAMSLLAEMAEDGAARGDLGFVTFDGKCVRIAARPRASGKVRAEVLLDGRCVSDCAAPSDARPALRAV